MKKTRGIRKKLTLTVTLLVVISLSLLGLVVTAMIFKTDKARLLTFQREVVAYAINEMSWDIHEIENLLNITVTNNALFDKESEDQYTLLSQILTSKDIRHHNILEELVLLDNTGAEVAWVSRTAVYTKEELGERSGADEFREAFRTGKPYYGELSFNEVTYEPRITVSIPVPDFRTGEVKGVLLGKLRMNRVWENVVTRSFGESGSIFISDIQGRVVAHADPSVIYRNTYYQTDGSDGIQDGLDGELVVLVRGMFRMGSQSFHVYTVMPFLEAVSTSLQALTTTAAFLIVFITCSIIVSFLTVSRIVRPIESLADNAREISAGNLDTAVAVGNSDEIGDLSQAFNDMTGKLMHTIDSLEHEVRERKLAELEINKSHERLLTVLNSLDAIVYVADMKTHEVLFINKYTRDVFGDVEGMTCWQVLQSGQQGPCEFCTNERLLTPDGMPAEVYRWEFRNTQNNRWYYIQDRAIYWVDNRIVRLEIASDITERKLAEEKISIQNELLNNILNALSHPFYVIDVEDYTIKLANPAAQFGKLTAESTCYALTHHADKPCTDSDHPCVIEKIKETKQPVTLEHIHYDGNGNRTTYEIHGYPVFSKEGKLTQVIEYNVDITKRKQAEEKIKRSLREKELLLREIHHRVKNNMQIISSLISLQSDIVSDGKSMEMLKDTQNRIKSMALIHEKLYRSEDLEHIDFGSYLRDLTSSIMRFYETASYRVTLHIQADDMWLGIDTAIPCGLIINELVTNSLKHAFSERREGEIHIKIERAGSEEILMIVSDNGSGIPEDLDIRNTKSLGLQLVTSLSESQLQGSVELDRTGGTTFRMKFKEIKYKKRT